MHSAEPFDRRSVNDPSQPAPADAAWRAEVASRVQGYRARSKSASGEPNSFALDPGSTGAAQISGRASMGLPKPETPQSTSTNLDARNFHAPSRSNTPGKEQGKPFDTRYYRRLNAQSRNAIAMGATAAATAPAHLEPHADYEAEESIAAMPEPASTEYAPSRQNVSALRIDLELDPAADVDAEVERPYIPDAEPDLPGTLLETESAPSGAAAVAAPAFPPQGNLIAFPRPFLEPPLLLLPSRDELAEPVHRRPRILEVPEDIMPAVQGSLFPAIRLDADEPEDCASREPEIEVPLPVAPVGARLMASIADLIVVAAAGALFAAIACSAMPEVPHTKPFWMGLVAVTMLLWAVYQHLFLLYAGRTVGMSMRGIHLSTFDGRTPEWNERRRRARFLFISFASVALGFLWALVDEDTLCWHDRLSQTFPTPD